MGATVRDYFRPPRSARKSSGVTRQRPPNPQRGGKITGWKPKVREAAVRNRFAVQPGRARPMRPRDAPWLEAALPSRATFTKPPRVARPRATFTKPKEDGNVSCIKKC